MLEVQNLESTSRVNTHGKAEFFMPSDVPPQYSQVQQAAVDVAERAKKAADELAQRQAEERRRRQEREEALVAESRRKSIETKQDR